MTWHIEILGLFVHIDAQSDPWAAILGAVAVGLALWFIVVQARRRDERRARARRDAEAGRTRPR